MIDKRYFVGVIFGFVIATLFSAEISDAAIPPTRAIQNLNITLPWSPSGSALVESDDSSDTFYFVSDGSITFNVTNSYP